jgi:hypothetical protein
MWRAENNTERKENAKRGIKGLPRKKEGLRRRDRRPVRANLRKERRRRNTFRVGHIQTPQMPSCHNRLLPSVPFLSARRISSSIFSKRLCLSLPSSSYNLPILHCVPLFCHHPALRGVSLPPSSFPLFWPSHTSSVTTLLLPLVSHPPYKYCPFFPTPFPTQ